MASIAVTGGIACGKSHASRRLASRLGATLFVADDFVTRLYGNPESLRERFEVEFGECVLDGAGSVSREWLREKVFEDPQFKRKLEAIVHPLVRAAWRPDCERGRGMENPFHFVCELPLLFETGGEIHFDKVLAITCQRGTQLNRLQEKRGVRGGAKIIDAQISNADKMTRADTVLWNDGGLSVFEWQIDLFSEQIRKRIADV